MTDIVEQLEEYFNCRELGEMATLLRLSLSEARATGRREGMEKAARIAEGPAAAWGDFSGGTPERDKIAAAIRAAMEKAE